MNWNNYIYNNDFSSPNLSDIMAQVKNDFTNKTIYPEYDNILKAFELTSLDNVKVVILGQDPYYNPLQANGLAFSVNKGVTLPRSLKNIFLELQDDLGGELRTNGDLSDWAKQGVFLLNTALTVVEGKPNSMKSLWTDFTNSVIRLINAQNRPIVFILWGNNAKSAKSLISAPQHLIIESAHPSPLSASKGFFGSKPFSKANKFLFDNNIDTIDWRGKM